MHANNPDHRATTPGRFSDLSTGTVLDRIESTVREAPGRIAIRADGRQLTYAQLWARAAALASRLDADLGRGSAPVALIGRFDEALLAAIIGVLCAGRPYVYLDRDLPPSRRSEVVAGFDVAVVVSSDDREVDFATAVPAYHSGRLDDAPSGWRPRLPGPADAAAITFTSGSTGRPAGVVVSHGALFFNVTRYGQALALSSDDRLSALASPGFAAATADIFAALTHGACLLPFDVYRDGLLALKQWLDDEGVTVYHSVPTLFRRLLNRLDGGGNWPTLRWIKLGGEPVYRADLERFRRLVHRGCHLMNGLGLSEAAGNIAYYTFAPGDALPQSRVPVGRALRDRELAIVDETGEPLAVGQEGEIAVRSQWLAAGYWGDEERTRARFEPLDDGRVQLRSGDRGRIDAAGQLIHLGRLDEVVKIRGRRVEPADCEARLSELSEVLQVAVVVRSTPASRDGNPPTPALVACIASPDNATISLDTLRSRLATELPDYLVPTHWEQWDALPLTAGGKIDRHQLVAGRPVKAPISPVPADARVARTPLEARAAAIWTDVLGGQQADWESDFFASGGTSIEALELLARFNESFEAQLTTADLVARPSLAGLIEQLAGDVPGVSPEHCLLPVGGHGDGTPIVLITGGIGSDEHLLQFGPLLSRLPRQPLVLGVRLGVLVGRQRAEGALESLAGHLADEVTDTLLEDRVHVVGECINAPLAVELAAALAARHVHVALTLLDPVAPAPSPWRRLWLSPRFEPIARTVDRWSARRGGDPGSVSFQELEARRQAVRSPVPAAAMRLWQRIKRIERLGPAIFGMRTVLHHAAPMRHFRRQLVNHRVERCPWPLHLVVTDATAPVVPAWQAIAESGFSVRRIAGRHAVYLAGKPEQVIDALALVIESET